MKTFADLFRTLDATTKTNRKVSALVNYFDLADDRDKVWTIALFTHRRPSRPVKTSLLREWASEISEVPLWLLEESYHIVGDLAESLSLLIPINESSNEKTLSEILEDLIVLKAKTEEEKKEYIIKLWSKLSKEEVFLFNKLITGGFRIGVSQKTIIKALSKHTDQEENVIAHRLMGNWDPQNISFNRLLLETNEEDNLSKPYPFYLAYALENKVEDLGELKDWQAEWKWDGIRGQVIKRNGNIYVWSRGEELVTEKYPEYQVLKEIEEDNFVLDGEILAFKEGKALPFQALQTRIGRKNLSKKILESTPVILMTYDLLEYQGEDIRHKPIEERKSFLKRILSDEKLSSKIVLSEDVKANSWSELTALREDSRKNGTEGLMLKRMGSEYKVGRKKGEWWKWKVDPMTVDAVMIYAQRGHGRRANMFTDFTFGAMNEDGVLVPFAKAYSGLTDKEFAEITKWVRKNTIERFGPVCSVKPELVFEIAFEGISESKRHKSGIALRFPRIKRWRRDKPALETDNLNEIKKLLN